MLSITASRVLLSKTQRVRHVRELRSTTPGKRYFVLVGPTPTAPHTHTEPFPLSIPTTGHVQALDSVIPK